jgi:tetratricopeptide (TPR) repeat protein
MEQKQFANAIQLLEEGKLTEAREALMTLLESEPDNPHLLFQSARVYDLLGRETDAIPYYERAISQGLTGPDLERAYIGLGSSYRCIGEYDKSAETLRQGINRFPNNRVLQVFLSMALYNTGEHREAMELLLRNLAETTSDESIGRYKKALLFYAGKLDETWK